MDGPDSRRVNGRDTTGRFVTRITHVALPEIAIFVLAVEDLPRGRIRERNIVSLVQLSRDLITLFLIA
ncbi:hypothetical protein QJS04_geneDACA005030 [Acorus gramineus]|uniref:Uncharacterized protein n=1 Tax=Acorus gramineus TaxID=55184 RepID=A0AAV9AX76_ACOGR|nr:hypothetical protein QJS04_geneDACA005030 [Acorus gramineus]